MGIILKPFAWLLLFLYEFFNSYGLALILFGFIVKLILFPVSLKSKKSMIQTSMLSGQLQQLKNQYGKNPERYNQEVQKLYERENVNPMGGCLWSLIPMFVLIGLYYIIREPMTYFMNLSLEQIQTIADHLNWETVAVANGWMSQGAMDKLLAKLAEGEITSVFENGAYNQVYLASLINEGNLATLQALVPQGNLMVINFSFLGLDLSAIPTWKFWANGISLTAIGLTILPLVSTAVSFLSMKVSMATNNINNNKQSQNAQMEQTNKMMMWMMPVMSLWIGFTVPAGLTVYWIAQYLVTMIQDVICSKLLKKDYEAARKAAEERARLEKEEEKKRKEEARLERARRIEEEKNNKGKKKKAAVKDVEPDQEGVNKNDSREGIRAYARGRAYIPNRFGGVTEYVDPNIAIAAELAAKGKKKGKNQPVAEKKEEEKAAEQTTPVNEIPAAPVEEPVETNAAAVETEVAEDENKEGV